MAGSLADLKRIKVLKDLPSPTLARIAEVAVPAHFSSGQLLFLAGEHCQAIYLLVSGHIAVYRISPEGRRQILSQIHPGEMFNVVPPFLPEPVNPASAEAITDVLVYAIRLENFQRLLSEEHDFALKLLSTFALRLQHMTALVEDLALHSVRERLARFLLDHADSGGFSGFTYDEMAERLGTVRDVIGRCLRAMEGEGILRRERGQLILLNRARLEAIALADS